MKRSILFRSRKCAKCSFRKVHFEAIKRFYNLRRKPFSMFLFSSVLQNECIKIVFRVQSHRQGPWFSFRIITRHSSF